LSTFANDPGVNADRVTVGHALDLEFGGISDLLGRLRASVSATVPDFVLTNEAGEYETLFGPWLPSRNPAWR
jgi:hypothetical protein